MQRLSCRCLTPLGVDEQHSVDCQRNMPEFTAMKRISGNWCELFGVKCYGWFDETHDKYLFLHEFPDCVYPNELPVQQTIHELAHVNIHTQVRNTPTCQSDTGHTDMFVSKIPFDKILSCKCPGLVNGDHRVHDRMQCIEQIATHNRQVLSHIDTSVGGKLKKKEQRRMRAHHNQQIYPACILQCGCWYRAVGGIGDPHTMNMYGRFDCKSMSDPHPRKNDLVAMPCGHIGWIVWDGKPTNPVHRIVHRICDVLCAETDIHFMFTDVPTNNTIQKRAQPTVTIGTFTFNIEENVRGWKMSNVADPTDVVYIGKINPTILTCGCKGFPDGEHAGVPCTYVRGKTYYSPQYCRYASCGCFLQIGMFGVVDRTGHIYTPGTQNICGSSCPVFIDGQCNIVEEMVILPCGCGGWFIRQTNQGNPSIFDTFPNKICSRFIHAEANKRPHRCCQDLTVCYPRNCQAPLLLVR